MTTMPIEKQDLDLAFLEATEFEPGCELFTFKPEWEPCGAPAAWKASLVISECGHVEDMYLCEAHYQEVLDYSNYKWICTQDNMRCGTYFDVRAAIVNIERIKP